MRSTWFMVCLLLAASFAGAQSVTQLVDRVSQNSASYQITVAEYELAMLQYESDIHTAVTADEQVGAELGRLLALLAYRNSITSFYHDVIDAVFDMATSSLALQAAVIDQEIAETDLAYAHARYDNGLISSSDFTEAELTYREQANSLAQAVFDEQEARSNLIGTTGLEWDTSLLPGELGPPQLVEPAAWVAADIPHQQSTLTLSKAERAADNPAGTISDFDQRSAELSLESAELDVQLALEASERAYRSTVRTLESDRVSLGIARERLALQQQLLTEANLRLDRGLITESQRDQQRVRLLQTDASYLEALRWAIKNIVSYRVSIGEPINGI